MKKNPIILVTLAALLFCNTQLFAQSKKVPPPPSSTATIQGRVIDRDTEEGISNAQVIARSPLGDYYFVVSDINGYYKIGNIKVWKLGSLYTITASATGYKSSADRVWVKPGGTYTVNFSLKPLVPPTAIIKGRVTDVDTGEGISQAKVVAQSWWWRHTGKWRYETYTDAQGNYEIRNIRTLRSGIYYRLSASKTGYHSKHDIVFIRPGQTYTVDFALIPVRPPVVLKITSPQDGVVIKEDKLNVEVYYRIHGWQRYRDCDEWDRIGKGKPHFWWFRRTIDLQLDGNVVGTFHIPFWQREGTHTFTVSNYSAGTHELQSFLYLDLWKKILLAKSNIVHFTYISDVTPPSINNLIPPDNSIINISKPEISAIVKDTESGVDPASIKMTLDGQTVTHLYNSPTGKVSYTPSTSLAEGLHKVDLTVKDNIGNEAKKTWSFTVDTVPPVISDLTPPDGSLLNIAQPEISAILSDATSGINTRVIVMALNGQTVTPTYNSSTGKVSYTPLTLLFDGPHPVTLQVKDKAGNSTSAAWSFTTDVSGPVITNVNPPSGVTIEDSKPTISANYSDSVSGIDINSVIMKVDEVDVTASANVTSTGISYTPLVNLANGQHNIEVNIKDLAGNLATATWAFTTYVKNLVDPGGGTASSDDGKAKVIVPEGAVSEPILLRVEVEDTSTLQGAVPSDMSLISAVDFGPDGQVFNEAVKIILPLDKAEVPGTSLKLFLYNFSTDTFEDTGIISPVNSDNTTVTFSVSHFSTYGALKSLISSGAPIGGGVQIPTPDLFTGAFGHGIPITVPPGRKDMQPALQLQYRSSNSNSWVGMGWTLNPGYITRSAKQGLPSYAHNDTFIYITAGSATEMVNLVDNLYQAKVESAFTKFFKEGDDSWKVMQKDGTIIYLGTTPEAKVSSPDGTFNWKITKVVDPNGNYIIFEYIKDRGESYLSRIQYTGNEKTGFAPKHSVNFILENRQDIASSYVSGSEVATAKRLKEIEAKVQDDLAWRYVFEYEYSEDTNRSLLKKVTQYGADGVAFPPQIFTYQKSGN